MEERRGVEVFIERESGESAPRARHARRGRANPNAGAARPEAAKRAPFTGTQIIL